MSHPSSPRPTAASRAADRDPLVQGAEPFALGGIERSTRQDRLAVGALEQVGLVGLEAEFVAHAVQHADAREEARIQADRVAVGGEPRGELRLEGVDGLVGVGRTRVLEHGQHPSQQFARPFEGLERVLERRRGRVGGDGLDLGALLAHAELDRLAIVLGSHQREQRQPVGERTGFEERIRRVGHPTTLWRSVRMPRRS